MLRRLAVGALAVGALTVGAIVSLRRVGALCRVGTRLALVRWLAVGRLRRALRIVLLLVRTRAGLLIVILLRRVAWVRTRSIVRRRWRGRRRLIWRWLVTHAVGFEVGAGSIRVAAQ